MQKKYLFFMVSFFENSSYEMTNIVITKSNYEITVVFIIKKSKF